ncbi:MAG: alanine--tRNA ligase-related protein [Candidatus Hodarchaeota archaeon]
MGGKLFYQDPYKASFDAEIIEVLEDGVVLDQTCFYPEGGGQVGDTGRLNEEAVTDTVKKDNKIVHIVDEKAKFNVAEHVRGKIDWERRYRIMKLHSAAHIVDHFFMKVFGEHERIGSNIDEFKSRCDYVYEGKLDPKKMKEVEDVSNKMFSEDHVIETWSDDKNPSYRYWKCENIEMACGGIHVRNTKEIGKIRLKRKNIGKGKERAEILLD